MLVQRRLAGSWQTVDSDLGLDILWTVDDNGVYRAEWEVPLGAPTGPYRFVVQANHYNLTSAPFTVAPSRALTATRSGGTGAAITLDYPPAVSHEAVGDPPGDSSADLTARPAHADSGEATFLVNGHPETATAGPNGVFQVSAPRGARIEVKPGAANDGYGNGNGNDLTFTS